MMNLSEFKLQPIVNTFSEPFKQLGIRDGNESIVRIYLKSKDIQ